MKFEEWLLAQPELTMGERDAARKAWVASALANDMFTNVLMFHMKFNLLQGESPTGKIVPNVLSRAKAQERVDFKYEELKEYVEALNNGDIDGQVDALVDLVYVALGTAVMMGVPWHAHWQEVHAKNMLKVRGVTKRGHRVDVTKPPGWTPPDHMKILLEHGYNPEAEPYDDPV